jgi:hypothetical protein
MFETSPHRYASDNAKVLAAGSYLKGDPKRWFSNFFRQPPAARPAWFSSWSDFKDELRKTWGLEDPEGAAESDIKHLHMNDKDHVAHYTSKFREIQYRLPNWSDRNLRNAYYQNLAPRIQQQFVTAGRVPPSSLDELMAVSDAFDRAYWANVEISKNTKSSEDKKSESKKSSSDAPKAKKRKTDSSQANSSSATTSTSNSNTTASSSSNTSKSQSGSTKKKDPPYKKYLGADGKLLPEERDRRIANGLCLLCGQKGHMANDCLKRTKQDSSTPTLARATITISPPAVTPASGEKSK